MSNILRTPSVPVEDPFERELDAVVTILEAATQSLVRVREAYHPDEAEASWWAEHCDDMERAIRNFALVQVIAVLEAALKRSATKAKDARGRLSKLLNRLDWNGSPVPRIKVDEMICARNCVVHQAGKSTKYEVRFPSGLLSDGDWIDCDERQVRAAVEECKRLLRWHLTGKHS